MAVKLFGFKISRGEEEDKNIKSFVPREDPTDDGALTLQSGFYGTYLDMDNNAKSDTELINKYREMAIHPEVEIAVDDIASEAIIHDTIEYPVKLYVKDSVKATTRKVLEKEFLEILKLLNFKDRGYDIFRNWYIDGRIYFHIIADETESGRRKSGIKELRFIDPRKIKKIRRVKKEQDNSIDPTNQANVGYIQF